MGQASDLERRDTVAEERVRAAAARLADAQQLYSAELEHRDRAIVDAIDAGELTVRQAARAAGLSPSGVSHIVARAG